MNRLDHKDRRERLDIIEVSEYGIENLLSLPHQLDTVDGRDFSEVVRMPVRSTCSELHEEFT